MRRAMLVSVPLTVALLVLVTLTLVVLASAVLALAPAALAQTPAGGTDFVVRPADGSPLAAEGGWFRFSQAAPGSDLSAELALRNDGESALTLRLAAVDATTAQHGGVAYGLPGDDAGQVGTWVDLERDTVRLEPGSSAVVPLTVRVPEDAMPGDHLGGLAVWSPDERPQPGAQEGMAPGVVIATRQVVAVQVQVQGTVTRSLEISGVRSAARPDGPYLEIVIANTGGRLEKGQGRVLVDGEPLGGQFSVDTMVPGTQVAYAVAWPGADLGEAHDVRVSLDYDGRRANWQGTVQPDEQVRQALDDWDAGGGLSFDGRILPWLLAGLICALLVILTLVRRRPQPDSIRPSYRQSRGSMSTMPL